MTDQTEPTTDIPVYEDGVLIGSISLVTSRRKQSWRAVAADGWQRTLATHEEADKWLHKHFARSLRYSAGATT